MFYKANIERRIFIMKLNEELNKIMKERFCKDTVIDNGHNDFEDKNTIILCIHLVNRVLLSHGTAYNIEF